MEEVNPFLQLLYIRSNVVRLMGVSAFGNELSRDAMKCKTHKEAAGYLADWLQKRINFLNDYWHK